ncbi:cytochrome p450 monooxygenase [Biscogniauxia mediterranea]|nr:cytochrome p450 monooxygenase [Biscogniauxia mediterranea]
MPLPPLTPKQGLVLPAFIILVLYFTYNRFFRKKRPYPFPPGPPGRFLIGNAGQLSVDHPERDYMRWGKEYDSDVIYTQVMGQPMVCLNSFEAATELLDRRGANYCDRPRFKLFEVMGWGLTLTFLRWGPQFKLHRRLFQNTFAQSNVKAFRSIQQHEARKAVQALVRDPTDWEELTLLMTTSIIFRIAFGQEVADKDSPYCEMAAAANDATTNGGIAGSTLVDVFPLARFLPQWLCPSAPLRHAHASRPAIQRIHAVPWEANMRDIEDGTAEPSFMRTHVEKYRDAIEKGEETDATLADIQGATGAVFIAGGNSTWGTVLSCMLFLTKYPKIQARIAAEIDTVLSSPPTTSSSHAAEQQEGREAAGERQEDGEAAKDRIRLPTFADRPRLRCVDNFVMEAMRCLPLNPLVIPHRSLRDDVYRGMFIPAGTTVFANAAAMAVDPATYRNPHVFDPDRYNDDDDEDGTESSSQGTAEEEEEEEERGGRGEPYPYGNFGFGRRRCPGNWLALASVHIFLSTLLAVFRLEAARDEATGAEKVPVPEVSVGLGGHPRRFKCRAVVRNERMARLLLEGGRG